jgi:hypothetical protein
MQGEERNKREEKKEAAMSTMWRVSAVSVRTAV